jgi:Tol biopolymer transport system component
MALQRTRRPRFRSGRSLCSPGSPLNARPLDGAPSHPGGPGRGIRQAAALLSAIAVSGLAATQNSKEQARYDFSAPANLGRVVNSPAFDGGPSISADGLSLFFTSERPGGSGGGDLWVTKRKRMIDPFTTPENLGAGSNSPANEFAPSISADGLSVFFDSDRPGGLGLSDVWVAARAATSESFGKPRNLGAGVNSSASDGLPSISADGLSLYFCSRRPGGSGDMDIWVANRTRKSEEFSGAENLGPDINGPHYDGEPNISADALFLFFSSDRPGGHGHRDIWVAARANSSAPFGQPRNLGAAVNGPAHDVRPSISADGSVLFFMSDRPGGFGHLDLWQASNRTRARARN